MPIPYADHLVPANETPLNKALAAVSTRLEGINAPARAVWDPYTCPEPFLPFLAHAFSVDLWKDSWHVDIKRRVIAEAVEMQGSKGTLHAAKMYLRYTEGRLMGLTRNPQRQFMGGNLGKEAREKWLERLPQIRVWKQKERSKVGRRMFSGGPGYTAYIFNSVTGENDSYKRLRRRARYVVDGQETDVTVTDFGSFYRLHLRSKKTHITVDGSYMGATYMGSNTAHERLVTVEPNTRLPRRHPLFPSMKAISHEPELITEIRSKPFNVFFGDEAVRVSHMNAKKFFIPSDAPLSVYHRYAINNGSTYVKPPAVFFLNVGRFGFPRHTVWYRISAPRKMPKVKAGIGIYVPKRKFWLPKEHERVDFVRRAMVAAKRASDRVFIETNWRPQIRADRDLLIADENEWIVDKPSQEAIYGTTG